MEAQAILGRFEAFAKEITKIKTLYGLEDYRDYIGPIGELSKLLYTNLHPVSERNRLIEQFRVRYLAPTSAILFPQAASTFPQSMPTPTRIRPGIVAASHSADTSVGDLGDTIVRPDQGAVESVKYSDAAFQLPSYHDGSAHLGKIIGIRKAGFGYRVNYRLRYASKTTIQNLSGI